MDAMDRGVDGSHPSAPAANIRSSCVSNIDQSGGTRNRERTPSHAVNRKLGIGEIAEAGLARPLEIFAAARLGVDAG
jgi:hypothetical protein